MGNRIGIILLLAGLLLPALKHARESAKRTQCLNNMRQIYVAFMVYADDAFGTETAAAFADGLAKNGGKVTGRSAVPIRGGDWAKVVTAIKAQPAKAVFAAFITDDAEGFITAWDAAGMRAAGFWNGSRTSPGPPARWKTIN